ncbi:HNH endonuclease [Panacibacter ginsenosidivorans]|uniref:HNH endonuclease n=1 Tax=Panacibacter ginsenosidivorans TaxID=1813871 RepID=A0A5B8VF53_9BACT|nr:HNH endonuclease [Panacibacter ginsenosidivorans]QEC69651.1 HNH endonuclease [Panacibacter ginsenosidivorans]
MTEQTIHLYTSPEYDDHAVSFFDKYDIQSFIFCPEEKQKMIIPPKERLCRFCKRKYPAVTFRNDAHIIPEALGNRYLTSEFECDECNQKFGKLDDQLIKFIGVSRSLNGTKAKKKTKIPKYPSADKKVLVQNKEFYSDKDALNIELTQHGNGSFIYDETNSLYKINFLKNPYMPLLVFQSLLKMAICVMNEKEIEDYEHAIEFLHVKKDLIRELSGLLLSGYLLPLTFGHEYPLIFLFKKKNFEDNIPTHVFVLHAKNIMLEIKIPLNKNDKFNYTKEAIKVKDCPPLFFKPYELHKTPFKYFRRDLSSTIVVKNDSEILVVEMQKGELNNFVAFNPTTNSIEKQKSFNPNEIKGIWLSNAEIKLANGDA